jgi:hypothetical protein
VCSEGGEIDAPSMDVDGDVAERLNRVRMNDGAGVSLLDGGGHLGDRLDRANLVINGHHRHHQCVVTDRVGYLSRRVHGGRVDR